MSHVVLVHYELIPPSDVGVIPKKKKKTYNNCTAVCSSSSSRTELTLASDHAPCYSTVL